MQRQSKEKIVARARVLGAVVQRGFYALHGASAQAVPWGLEALVSSGMWEEASALERRLLTVPTAALDEELAREAMWSCEALAVLCWALGLREAPEQDADVAPYSVLGVLPEDVARWSALDVVREDAALELALWRWFWVHRRVLRFLSGAGVHDLMAEIEDHPRSPQPEVLGLVLTPAEGDLEVWEAPLGALDVEELPYGRGFARVSAERLQIMRWLCGVSARLDAIGDNPADPWSGAWTTPDVLVAEHLSLDDAREAQAWGTTLAHLACARGADGVLAAALGAGADPMARDALGDTIAHVAAREGQHDALRVALDAGAASDAPGWEGMTPLHLACARQDGAALALLLGVAGDRDPVDARGQTPLMRAIAARWRPGVEALLDARASKNGFRGVDPALHHAIAAGDLEIVRLLLARGADPSRPNALGQTPHAHAVARGWREGADALVP